MKNENHEFWGVSMDLVGSSSAESDLAITWQIARLRTPRARATEPDRGPNLRLAYARSPLRAPQPREREKTRGRRRGFQCAKKKCLSFFSVTYHMVLDENVKAFGVYI